MAAFDFFQLVDHSSDQIDGLPGFVAPDKVNDIDDLFFQGFLLIPQLWDAGA
jgi:hypothetical protein